MNDYEIKTAKVKKYLKNAMVIHWKSNSLWILNCVNLFSQTSQRSGFVMFWMCGYGKCKKQMCLLSYY